MSLHEQKPEEQPSSTLFSDPGSTIFTTDNQASGQKKAPKKKRLLATAAICLCLALVGGLVGVLIATAPEKEPEPVSKPEEELLLLDRTPEEIDRIVVTHPGEEPFTIHQKPAGGFVIDALKEFEPQNNRYNAMTKALSKLKAAKLVTKAPKNLADYGLAKPSATLDVTFQDGQSYTLLVGNTSSTMENGSFMKFADRDEIYISSSALFTNAPCKIEDYVSTTVIPALEQNPQNPQQQQTVDFLKIELFGAVRPQPIVILPTPKEEQEKSVLATTYYISAPRKAYVNSDVFTRLTDNLFGVFASSVSHIHPTEQEKKDCGLTAPFSAIAVSYKGGSYELLVGKQHGDSYYVMKKGVDLIYEVPASAFIWLNFQLADLHTPFLYAVNVKELAALDLTHGGTTYHFTIAHQIKENEFGGQTDEMTVRCNGAPLNTELFKAFYQVLITQRAGEVAQKVTDPKPELTLHFETTNGKDPIDVRFFPTGARTRGVEVNGEMTFQTSLSYIDNLMENLQKLLRNESITVDS